MYFLCTLQKNRLIGAILKFIWERDQRQTRKNWKSMHKVLSEILFQCTVYNGGIFLNKSAKCHLMAITKTNIFTKSHRNVSFLLHGLILQDFLVKFHFSAQCIMTAYFKKNPANAIAWQLPSSMFSQNSHEPSFNLP